MGRQVAVTGASGNLGRALLERLSRDPEVERIVALDRVEPPRCIPKAEFHRCDIRAPGIGGLLEGCDALLHLAFVVEHGGRDDQEVRAINLGGTRNVCEAAVAVGVRQIVYASSIAAYGFHPEYAGRVLAEDAPLRGNEDFYYTRDKAAVEVWLDRFERAQPELRLARLRPSVFLSERSTRPAARLFRARWLVVPGGPQTPLHITHEDDVVAAFVLALHARAHGAFNLATEEPLTVGEIARILGKRLVPVPAFVLGLYGLAYRLHLVDVHPTWLQIGRGIELVVSSERARKELGWEPRLPTTADVVRRLAARPNC